MVHAVEAAFKDAVHLGDARLKADRRAALDRFLKTGLPTARDEAWKYTPLRGLERRRFVLPDGDTGAPDLDSGWPLRGPRLVFRGGRLDPVLSRLRNLPPGVEVMPIAEALEDEGGRGMAPGLESDLDSRSDAFANLNAALFQDGVRVRVTGVVDEPLELVYTGGGAGTMSHLRNVIEIGQGGRLALVERFTGGDCGLMTVMGRVALDAGAVLQHHRLQAFDGGSLVNRMDVTIGADAVMESHQLDMGSGLARHDLNLGLDGAGARCDLNGLYLSDGRAHVDNHVRVDHSARTSVSRLLYKGVAGGRGRAVFNGKVIVHPQGQGADAQQSNANLLLSRTAEIDAKPELEIYADDVKCSHGATVGQLDPEALFYLRSRGIDEEAARALLIAGFCRQVLDRFTAQEIRDYAAGQVSARLAEAST